MNKRKLSMTSPTATCSKYHLLWGIGIALLFIMTVVASCNKGGGQVTESGKVTELDGLQASISKISWIGSDTVEINYMLKRVGPATPWILNPTEPVGVKFWDADEKRVTLKPDRYSIIVIEEKFISEKADVNNAVFSTRPPKNATSVSVALGRSGLETHRKKLPAQP